MMPHSIHDGQTPLRASDRLAPIFLPHGGGPWPFMDTSAFGSSTMYDSLRSYLEGIPSSLAVVPSAILVISAHWEESEATVMASPTPPMLYDYSGFPRSTYDVQWPAPGAPELAMRVRSLLHDAGLPCGLDSTRGFDHGTFVPLYCAYPRPTIPTIQLSLVRGLDPARHIAIGKALQALTYEGVLIVGSGMSYHNMRGFFGREKNVAQDSQAFDSWLTRVVSLPESERTRALLAWAEAPRARECHPREEHLLPLHVVAGAAGVYPGASVFSGDLMGARISGFQFM